MKPDLREIVRTKVLLGDGAMGTYLYQLGFPVGVAYEEFNLTQPETIEMVHKRYYDAGARLIETNTYSANREKLSKFGLEAEVPALNRAGVELARRAVGSDAYVVGSVGSVRSGRRRTSDLGSAERALSEQMDALLAAGVDGLLLETFFDLDEMLVALRAARKLSMDVPVICQFAADTVGHTGDGRTFAEALQTLMDEGADVFGFNCRSGPFGIAKAMEKLGNTGGTPLSVFPNAGMPNYTDGTYSYGATPEYFATCVPEFVGLGARIVGGCCGTTPEHIQAMAKALEHLALPADKPLVERAADIAVTEPGGLSNLPADRAQERTASTETSLPTIVEQAKRGHAVIVELDPPRDLDIEKFMKGAAALKDAGADAVTLADNSMAVTRMSNLALGSLMNERLGIRPLLHLACRDRNLIGTQSHLMGLHALGIDHVLAVTGDPARFGDLPGSSSVYDMTSFEIIRMIKQLNEGVSFSGKPLKQKAKFVVGAAFNPNVKYLDKAVQRLEKKIQAGADFIMTQPIYDPLLVERVHEATKHLPVPIFIGVMPFTSGRNAEFLHNEVPGIQLPDDVRKRIAGLEGTEGRRVSLEISKELLNACLPRFNGIYLITPFLAYEMTVELTKYVWSTVKRPSQRG